MDKTTETKRVITDKWHEYYCDDCGKLLMKCREWDDGYIPEPKSFYIQHVKLKGHHCEECANRRIDEVVKFVNKMGFDLKI